MYAAGIDMTRSEEEHSSRCRDCIIACANILVERAIAQKRVAKALRDEKNDEFLFHEGKVVGYFEVLSYFLEHAKSGELGENDKRT